MPTDLTLLAAQYALDELDVGSLKDIAIQAVCDGIDGRSMVYLAGTTAADTPAELPELFVAALREHGQPIPSWLDAAKQRIRDIAAGVAEGRIAPRDGASQMLCLQDAAASESHDMSAAGEMLGMHNTFVLYVPDDDDESADVLARIDAAILAECRVIAGR